MKKIIKKFIPIELKQCSQCSRYSIQIILLNGNQVCHGCYNRCYTKSFHLV